MTERNWNNITSGPQFEGLVRLILSFEDSKAALFGRPGKDGGQDVRSGDGKTVFQAKHHIDPTPSKAIADAKKEAEKIRLYRTPGHSRYDQWKEVTKWRLVTNTVFNPNDQEHWKNEVVPLFQDIELEAEFWGTTKLDEMLAKYPEVDRHYFEGENRAFLTIQEAKEKFRESTPFAREVLDSELYGREKEKKILDQFVASDQLFLVFHGAGGIGKSRLLLELGEEIEINSEWQVLWANAATMEATSNWLEGVIPERPTLLLVDEPESETLLAQIDEQLGPSRSRTSKWKVVIAVRSPKDPVLQFLRRPRVASKVCEAPVGKLVEKAARQMCEALLRKGPLKELPDGEMGEITKALARRFNGHPIWMELAVHLLEKNNDLAALPTDSSALAEKYIEEIYTQGKFAPEEIRGVMRWVALLGTVNRESSAHIAILQEGSGVVGDQKLLGLLEHLVQRRALFMRGAYDRLVEIKPDVIRDHILEKWLTVAVGFGANLIQPSDEANTLVEGILREIEAANISLKNQSALEALTRTEILLSMAEDREIPIVAPVFTGILAKCHAFSASARVLVAELLTDIAHARPLDVVAISKAFREDVVDPQPMEGLYRSREVGQVDVVLELAWLVFHAAMGARDSAEREGVFRELLLIAEEESKIKRESPLPNDGKRTEGLIPRVLGGGPQFLSNFEDEVEKFGNEALQKLEAESPELGFAEVTVDLLKAATSLEREQTWAEDNVIHLQKATYPPGSKPWNIRKTLVEKTREILMKPDTAEETRLLLWDVLVEAQRGLRKNYGEIDPEHQPQVRQEILETLRWTGEVLAKLKPGLKELQKARDIWDWHVRFDKDVEMKEEAERLEDNHNANPLVTEFGSLNNWDLEPEEREQKARENASALIKAKSTGEIEKFLDRAAEFYGEDRTFQGLWEVAAFLGEGAREAQSVQDFVLRTLGETEYRAEQDFAISVAYAWVAKVRQTLSKEEAWQLVFQIFESCGSTQIKIWFLKRFYQPLATVKNLGGFSVQEIEWLRAENTRELFAESAQLPAFLEIVGWTIHHDWEGLKTLVEEVIGEANGNERIASISALGNSIYWAVRTREEETLPPDLSEWLMNQVIRVFDISELNSNVHWRLEKTLEKAGKLPLSWLLEAIDKRMREPEQKEKGYFKVLSGHPRLTKYIQPVEQSTASDPQVLSAIDFLLNLIIKNRGVGFYLPTYLVDIDPDGLIVPKLIAERIDSTKDEDAIYSLAIVAGQYKIGTEPWRVIARSVISTAKESDETEKFHFFSALCREETKAWTRTRGEAAPRFVNAVGRAKSLRDAEEDSHFSEFWDWFLKGAEAQLRSEEELAKEERGE